MLLPGWIPAVSVPGLSINHLNFAWPDSTITGTPWTWYTWYRVSSVARKFRILHANSLFHCKFRMFKVQLPRNLNKKWRKKFFMQFSCTVPAQTVNFICLPFFWLEFASRRIAHHWCLLPQNFVLRKTPTLMVLSYRIFRQSI